MSVKIREAGCLSELKETKQKVMEFETQVTIFNTCCFKFGLFYRFFFHIIIIWTDSMSKRLWRRLKKTCYKKNLSLEKLQWRIFDSQQNKLFHQTNLHIYTHLLITGFNTCTCRTIYAPIKLEEWMRRTRRWSRSSNSTRRRRRTSRTRSRTSPGNWTTSRPRLVQVYLSGMSFILGSPTSLYRFITFKVYNIPHNTHLPIIWFRK